MAEGFHDHWLPFGTRVGGSIVVGHVVASGRNWQMAKVAKGGHALIVRDDLKDRWLTGGLISEGQFAPIALGEDRFYILDGGMDHVLAPLSRSASPDSGSAALSFAKAMGATRMAGEVASFVDAIFVERLSRILPTYTSDHCVDDATVLGTWLTGGLPVDARSAEVTNLLTWMSPSHLQDVLEASGCARGSVPAQTGAVELQAEKGRLQSDERFLLPGRAALEAFFNDHVVDVVQNPDQYRALGLLHPPSIVLAGPPGCGKTVAVKKLIEFLGWPSYSVQADSIASPYIHETSRKVSDLFQRAIDTAPSVLVIDEMDAFLAERETSPSSSHRNEEVAEFLRRIPEATMAGVLVVGMTNRLSSIDAAVLRRGRFDHVVTVDFATETEVTSLLESLTSGLPMDDRVQLPQFAKKLAGRPLSDAAFVIREGARLAARKRSPRIDLESLELALASALTQGQVAPREPIGFIRMREQ